MKKKKWKKWRKKKSWKRSKILVAFVPFDLEIGQPLPAPDRWDTVGILFFPEAIEFLYLSSEKRLVKNVEWFREWFGGGVGIRRSRVTRLARLTFTIKIPPLLLLPLLIFRRSIPLVSAWKCRGGKKGGKKERRGKRGRECNKIGKRKVERIAVAAKRSVSLVRVCLINLVSPEYFSL